MNKLKKVAIALAVILFIISNIKYTFGVTGKITAETIRVRAEASTDSKIIVIGNAGEKAEILGLEGDWYKVRFKEKEGYIYKDYLEPEGTVENTTTDNTPSEETPSTETPSTETPQETTTPSTEPEKTMELGNVINSETQAYLIPSFTSTKVMKLSKDKEVKVNTTMANWAKIEADGVEAWVPKVFLMKEVSGTTTTQPEEQPEEPTTETQPEQPAESLNKAAYISSNASANLRSGPSTTTTSIGKLPKNTKITIIAEEGDWYKVNYDGKEGYISKTLVTEGEPPASATSSRSQEEPRTYASASVSESDVVQVAESYYGSRYVSGGSSPSGFDCSGFTQYVYGKCGKTISRTSYTQANEGTAVSKSELQPGDLLLFHYYGSSSIGHVGIYVGDGKFIHAANSNRGVVYDSITSGYYAENYAGARRL